VIVDTDDQELPCPGMAGDVGGLDPLEEDTVCQFLALCDPVHAAPLT
jgi:hypothetical protein